MATTDQIKAIESRKKKVFVSASAGTGKTETMVNRVIGLVTEDKIPLSSLVMLTFTEAAAEEMKSRLEDALLARVKRASGEERAMLSDALDYMPFLHCSTIDSFCYSLVRAHFEYLGLSPMHALVDETVAESYREKAVKVVLDDFAYRCLHSATATAESTDGYYDFLACFGKKEEDNLKKSMIALYNYTETGEDGAAFLQKAEELLALPLKEHPAWKEYLAFLLSQTQATLDELLPRGEEIPSHAEKTRLKYNYMINTLKDFSCCKSLETIQDKASKLERMPSKSDAEEKSFPDGVKAMEEITNSFSSWRNLYFGIKDDKALFKMSAEEVKEGFEEARKNTLTLIDLVRRFKQAYQEIKEEEKALDYADVEHYALTLLKDHGIGKDLECRHLLVDECQDLNPLQDALMRLLVGEEALFMVGDVKQSIYRFRLSDPEIFQRRVEEGEKDKTGTEVIHFDENFRSSDEVIAFVNTVFSRLMSKDYGGIDYQLANRGGRHDGNGGVRCFFYHPEKKKTLDNKIYSVKEDLARIESEETLCPEAEWVKRCIRELVGKTLYSTKDNSKFQLSYKDILILSSKGMRPGTKQEKVIRCLRDAGIPLNLGDFVRESEYPEIDSLVDFLRLIQSPNDDYAMLSVMRSDLFGFTVKEITEISRLEGKTFVKKAESAALAGNAKLEEMFAYLQKMRFLSSTLSLYETVSLLIDEKLRLPLAKRADGRKVFGEVLSFADTLKTGKATASIAEYLPYFDKYFKMSVEGEVAERDAVNVMTIHKSKGTQAPVVFVIGAEDELIGKHENDLNVRIDKEYGVFTSTTGKKNLISEIFKLKKKKELKEDKLRLLYVALTRARNYLFVSGEIGEGKEKVSKKDASTITEWMLCGIRGAYEYESELLPEEEEAAREDTPTPEPVHDDQASQAELLRAALSYKYPHESATQTGIKFTVTAINAMEEEEYCPPTMLFPEEKKAKGTAFHAVMEHLPFDLEGPEQTQAFLQKLAEDGLISAESLRDLSAKKVYGAIKEVKRIVGDRKVLREKSFLLHVPAREINVGDTEDEVEVQGKIDLLAIGEGDAVVLDYKLSSRTKEELIKKYRAQLDLYALATSRSLGIPEANIHKYIFVLGRNELIKV